MCRHRHSGNFIVASNRRARQSLGKTHSRRISSFFSLPTRLLVFDKIIRWHVSSIFVAKKISQYTQKRPLQLYLFGQIKFDYVFYSCKVFIRLTFFPFFPRLTVYKSYQWRLRVIRIPYNICINRIYIYTFFHERRFSFTING